MGWKKIKEHYGISHIVQVTEEGICIGSGFIHNIIIIGLDGTIIKRYDGKSNDDLSRYQNEIDADPSILPELIKSPDYFEQSVVVYTYNNAEIIVKRCEKPGWPNVTHDGLIMYENLFSSDKSLVIKWAKQEAAAKIKTLSERTHKIKEELKKTQGYLSDAKEYLTKLNSTYIT